jgi:hypothetical protein
MNKETRPSLLLIKLSALVLLAVFLSGIVEIVCLAVYAHKTNYSIFSVTEKGFSKPEQSIQTADKSEMLIFSQTNKQ